MKKLSAIIVSIMILSSIARSGVYIIEDDVMQHMFWVNTDNALRYGNQLLMFAVVTDYRGNVITTDAMVTYDAVYHNNINLIHYGNYCIFATGFNLNGSYCNIAQTSPSVYNVKWFDDYITRATAPGSVENLSQLASEPDIPVPITGADAGQNCVMDTAGPAPVPTGAGFYLRNTLNGDRYYLHDFYRVGDPNFNFYIVTLTVQPGYTAAPTEGLLFLQDLVYYGKQMFVAIITVFEGAQTASGYSLAGLYDPQDNTEFGHYFVMINGVSGCSTMVY